MGIAEIEVPRRGVAVAASMLALLGLVVLGFLGWANSPHDVQGRPLLLTRERRAVQRYLVAARGWAEELSRAAALLDGLGLPGPEAEPTEGPLPAPPAPAEQPADLYRRARQAGLVREALEALARDVERTFVPEGLVGLHGLVQRALAAHLAWAEAVLVTTGAPGSVGPGEVTALRDEALAAGAALEEALP